ncbi:MAG: alpha/beta hydrolase [Acidimicrobiia bacterium]|nr:alpha/beta hydrolase [Acidimicrobiia bacterium]
MPVVLVHGNPETAAVWAKLRGAISRESTALSLPGFGCPRPGGFDASMDSYAAWLLGELDRIEGPVDLVGHDWGGLLTYRVATSEGHRLRSWVADVAHLAHRDYEWHDFAKLWQTPDQGEAFMESQNELPPEERAQVFEAMGVPSDDALEMAAGSDATMGGCILDLYRSATPNPHHRWGPWTPTTAPGLVLDATEDPFGDETLAGEVAEALGARFERIEGAGHFWPYQAPDKAASILESFWSSLP